MCLTVEKSVSTILNQGGKYTLFSEYLIKLFTTLYCDFHYHYYGARLYHLVNDSWLQIFQWHKIYFEHAICLSSSKHFRHKTYSDKLKAEVQLFLVHWWAEFTEDKNNLATFQVSRGLGAGAKQFGLEKQTAGMGWGWREGERKKESKKEREGE